MKKVAYIIPGFDESHLKQKGYDKIAAMFAGQGITPVHVDIKWDYKKPIDFDKYNKQFLKKLKNHANEQVYVFGFSFGALIAFLTASIVKPDKLILCSLSPYFREDQENIKVQCAQWWKQNYINVFSFKEIIKTVAASTILVVGDKERESVIKRAKLAKREMINSRLVLSKGARHTISQKEYLETLSGVIGKL